MSHLHRAARLGNLDDVKQEIRDGADVNGFSINGFTPLMLAAPEGHVVIVEALVAAGANIAAVSTKNRTGLHFAASYGKIDVVVRLVDLGAPVDGVVPGKSTPALDAAACNYRDVVEFLLARGASPDVRDSDGRTPSDSLAIEGVFGASRKQDREDAEKRATGWRPEAREQTEATVWRLMAECATAEEYAARHGRHTLMWGFPRDKFKDPATDAWVQRVGEILFTPGLLAKCEEAHLTSEDLDDARKMRSRLEKRRARGAGMRP